MTMTSSIIIRYLNIVLEGAAYKCAGAGSEQRSRWKATDTIDGPSASRVRPDSRDHAFSIPQIIRHVDVECLWYIQPQSIPVAALLDGAFKPGKGPTNFGSSSLNIRLLHEKKTLTFRFRNSNTVHDIVIQNATPSSIQNGLNLLMLQIPNLHTSFFDRPLIVTFEL